MLSVTCPAAPYSELASISLVLFPGMEERCSMPKMPAAWIWMLPPLPWKALAIMSLPLGPTGGSAMTNLVSMLMLPPLAALKALAEIRLSFSSRRRSKPIRVIFAPPWGLLFPVSASSVPRLRNRELAVMFRLPACP